MVAGCGEPPRWVSAWCGDTGCLGKGLERHSEETTKRCGCWKGLEGAFISSVLGYFCSNAV